LDFLARIFALALADIFAMFYHVPFFKPTLI